MFAIDRVEAVARHDGAPRIDEDDGFDVPAETSSPRSVGDPGGRVEPGAPATVDDPFDDEIGSLSDEDLENELATHAAQIAAAEARFCLLVEEVDRRGFWYVQGASTCAHWLSWRCGMSAGVAREHIRVGRALRNLPSVRRAFSCGELSYSKARAITRIATPEIEDRLVYYARYATASQLENIVRGFRKACPNEVDLANRRHRLREVSSTVDDEGMVIIRARLAPEEGALVLAAIEAARETLRQDENDAARAQDAESYEAASRVETVNSPAWRWNPAVETGVPAETRPESFPLAGRADALVAICEAAIAGDVAVSRALGPRASVIVHVDEQVLYHPRRRRLCERRRTGTAVAAHGSAALV